MIRLVLCTLWLAVVFAAAAEPQPGKPVFGSKNYIEYIPGDLPLIISAPHGGREQPEGIPDRSNGVLDSDANTQELVRTIAAEIHARTGHHAHIVICRLHRRKLDCNREIAEAAAGNPVAENAWKQYHRFLEEACAAVVAKSGCGFFIDLHGQSHKDPRIELGYLHSAESLAKPDAILNTPAFAASGSLRFIAERATLPYTELLRGPRSLGAMLESGGFPATPSPQRPVPTQPYFKGGYTLARRTMGGARVAGLQIEANRTGVRDTAENRARFARVLVPALQAFVSDNLGLSLDGKAPRTSR